MEEIIRATEETGDVDGGVGGTVLATRYSLDVSTGGDVDGGGTVLSARYSLDVSAGCGVRRSTLLDEYERLAFEAQLNWAILRRCRSEPSPARTSFVQQPADDAPPATRGSERQDEAAAGTGRTGLRLHEVVARLLQALKPVLCWLRSAWERRRGEQAATPRRPPPTVPRVQLLDYLC